MQTDFSSVSASSSSSERSPKSFTDVTNQQQAMPFSNALILALLSGILIGLSHPVVVKLLGPDAIDSSGFSGLLIFTAYVPLLFAVQKQTPLRAFFIALLAFTLKGVVTAYWIVTALSHFGGLPFAAGVIAMVVLMVLVGGLIAAAFPAMRTVEQAFHFRLHWLFPIALCGVEFSRTQLPFGGNPWVTASMALAPLDVLRQNAALVGATGLVFFVGLINSAFFALFEYFFSCRGAAHRAHGQDRGQALHFPMRITALAGTFFVLALSYGSWRLAQSDAPPKTQLKIALLQASIPQDVLNNAAGNAEEARQNRAQILEKYHDLQKEALLHNAELVIWPEASLRPGARADAEELTTFGTVSRDDWSRGKDDPAYLDSVTPAASIVGSVAIFRKVTPAGKLLTRFHTSAFATERGFRVVGRWDKKHLLPFGEQTPWPLGAIVSALVHVGGILEPGTETPVRLMNIGDKEVKIGTSICYEGVFANPTRSFAQHQAQLHVNITNDAWYGVSSEMEQHLQHYAMRATESGIPVVRAANSGISAYYDNKGRLKARTKRDERTALMVDVPLQKGPIPTLYTLIGDVPALIALLLTLLGWLLASLQLKGGLAFLSTTNALQKIHLSIALLFVPIGLSLRSQVILDEGLYTLAECAALWGLLCVLLFSTRQKSARYFLIFSHIAFFLLALLASITLHPAAGLVMLGPILGLGLSILTAQKDKSESAANDAESAANDAESAANDAESTANDAESAVNDAESAANDAESAANDAESAANDVESAALEEKNPSPDSNGV